MNEDQRQEQNEVGGNSRAIHKQDETGNAGIRSLKHKDRTWRRSVHRGCTVAGPRWTDRRQVRSKTKQAKQECLSVQDMPQTSQITKLLEIYRKIIPAKLIFA